MQYLCLVYVQSSTFEGMPLEEQHALDAASIASDEELRQSGHLILAQALGEPETAVTVRVRAGSVSTTVGPFAETTEHLGGFVFVEARDLNEAIGIASRLPVARYGSIEVRPARDLLAEVQERAAR